MKTEWTEERRAKQRERLAKVRTPASQSARRLAQISHEEQQADKLRADGFEVFSPTVVCDRIAIRDGKVYFVEFKKAGQELRTGQQKVRDLAVGNYLIVYS